MSSVNGCNGELQLIPLSGTIVDFNKCRYEEGTGEIESTLSDEETTNRAEHFNRIE